MSKLLLRDYWGDMDSGRSLLSEADLKNISNGALIIAGKVHEAEILNHNNRIYPKSMLVREVENYRKLIKQRRSIGELDHPDRPIIEFSSVSHLFTDIWWENNSVFAKIEILKDIPKGQILVAMHNRNIPIGMSSRGVGSLEKVRGKNYVSDDYQIICWDAVTDPSTPNAFADRTLSESYSFTRNEENYGEINDLSDLMNFVKGNHSLDFWRF